jgi:hypothetical protein
MKLRQLFENRGNSVGVCFGRWNPPHKGHKAAWEIAASFGTFYVGTNKNTEGPNDPLPYEVKLKCMETIWPEIAGHVIPEQSLFTLVSKIFAKHGERTHLKVATDEDWLTKSLIQYNGKEGPHGYYKFASIEQIPTPRLSSATALRAAVRAGDREGFSDAAGVDADTPIRIGKKTVAFFDLVEHYLSKHPEKVKKVKKVAEHKKGVRAMKYTKKPVNPLAQHQKAKEKLQPIKPGVEKQTDECAGVGTITKQNSTADVNKGTPYKNLKAFNLVKEGIDMRALADKAKQMLAQGMSEQQVTDQLVKQGIPLRYAQQAVAAAQMNEIAGAFPSPSTRQKWADDAAASNRAMAAQEAERQRQARAAAAAKLSVNTANVDRLNKVNYHGADAPKPSNAEWDGDSDFLELDGTQYSKASRMPISGDVPSDMKLVATKEGRQVYLWTRRSLKGVQGHYFYPAANPKTIQQESSLDTYMAERAAYLAEAGMKKIDKAAKGAMKNASTLPALNMSTGSAYMNYRMGIALAGAPDYPTKMEADNWIGGDPLLSTYTEEEFDMIKKAAKQVGAGTIQNWSGKRSEEVADVNKTSPVAKPKKNKYGV